MNISNHTKLLALWTVLLGARSSSTQEKKCSLKGNKANCTGLNLTYIPGNIPTSIKKLLLNRNKFSNLSKDMFNKFTLLEYLDISRNILTSLDVSAFNGLSNLKVLKLARNLLLLNNQTYPEGLFHSLTNLEVLDLRRNDNTGNRNATYNHKAFSDLLSLQELYIDGIQDVTFGEGFSQLKNLTKLSVSGWGGYCFISRLSNTTFKHLSRLWHLDISKCKIWDIESNTFWPMRYIRKLDLSYNRKLGFDRLGSALYGLQGSAIQILNASYIVSMYHGPVDVKVKHLRYLNQTKLNVLYLDGNAMSTVESFVPTLFMNLKELYIRKNMLLTGLYLFGLDPMSNLTLIDGSFGHYQQGFPFIRNGKQKRFVGPPRNLNNHNASFTNHNNNNPQTLKFNWNPKFEIPIPKNLKSINSSHCTLSGSIYEVNVSRNNVASIDVSSNLIIELIGPFYNVDNVLFLDISNNYIRKISFQFLMYARNVRVLNFSRNSLGESFQNDTEGLIFFHQTCLRTLHISNNEIKELPLLFFQNMNDLEFLDVSNNDLIDWVPKISHMRNLSLLDISRNRFEDIPTKLRKTITQLTKHRQMQLKISGNSFKCDCAHLQSLYWMSTSNINITDLHLATCTLWNGETKSLDNLQDVLMSLQKHCQTTIPIILGAVVALIFFLIILISGFVYRYRWKLRYLYYITKRRYQRVEVQDDFIYDAFVSYADEDTDFVINDMRHMLEDEFGLKLCIHHRDFMVGQVISENILDAVKSSRKTIVILSPQFLKSSWCNYEVQMAKMEAIHTGRDVICVLWYQDVPDTRNISSDLLQEMANNTYIKYPGLEMPLPESETFRRVSFTFFGSEIKI